MLNIAPDQIGPLHFVGIGGIGMSGIAETLKALGYAVQGSDLNESANTRRLTAQGIPVLIGHTENNLKTAEGKWPAAVIISSAVKPGNPELEEARRRRIPIVRRADMLAELMRFRKSIAIAGTHGKTTTTSLVGAVLEAGKLDPTIINGGIIHAYGTNTRLGAGPWMVVEADESDGTFNRLPATIAVVTNIDPEHMDHYRNFDNVRQAFRNFIENIPFYGFAALCIDHPEVLSLSGQITDRRIITYGFSPQADARAVNMTGTPRGSTFDLILSGPLSPDVPRTISGIFLPMMGPHNVTNALAALAVGAMLNLPDDLLRRALSTFQGVKRRFTRTGESHGITVIDDYGHHPVEIRAVLKAGRQALEGTTGKIIAVVQPHRYTRLQSLFEEFATCLHDADHVIVTDVYPAGEDPIPGVDGAALAVALERHGHRSARPLPAPDVLPQMVADIAAPGDMVICLGAGNITAWANALPADLDRIRAAKKEQAHG